MAAGKAIFSILVGAIYCLFGIVQILGGILPDLAGALEPLLIPADIVQGFVLCVIGAVFLYGAREMNVKGTSGEAFLYVGMLLSVGFGAIMLLDIGAQGVDTILFGEEGENSWPLTQFIVPMLYLAVFSAAGLFTWGRGFLREIAPA